MNATQATKYLLQLGNVEGVFVTDPHGNLLTSEMPAIYEQQQLAEIASGASNMLETFKTEMEDCEELKLSLELKTLFVRQADGGILFALLESDEQADQVRIAANVAAKRFKAAATAQADPGSLNGHSDSQPGSSGSVSITSSLFGRRSKPVKEKKQDGGIWG